MCSDALCCHHNLCSEPYPDKSDPWKVTRPRTKTAKHLSPVLRHVVIVHDNEDDEQQNVGISYAKNGKTLKNMQSLLPPIYAALGQGRTGVVVLIKHIDLESDASSHQLLFLNGAFRKIFWDVSL